MTPRTAIAQNDIATVETEVGKQPCLRAVFDGARIPCATERLVVVCEQDAVTPGPLVLVHNPIMSAGPPTSRGPFVTFLGPAPTLISPS